MPGGDAFWLPLADAAGDTDQLTAAPAGGWTWFTDPRAVTFNGRTYFGYVRGDNGDVAVRVYDHATDTVSAETVLSAAFEVDDHANPAILIRESDKRVLVFYTKHNDPDGIRLRISTNAEDISAFGAETVIDVGGTLYGYASPHQITAEANDPIFVFCRDSNFTGSAYRQLSYTKSTDDGATFAALTAILDGAGRIPYWKHASNGERIDFAVSNGHPTHDGANALYHFYYQGGAWYRTDGTQITAAMPWAFSELTPVYSTGKSWVHDVALGQDGHPRIVFAAFPTDSDHRYRYARWTGTAWVTDEIVAAGDSIETLGVELHYSGGIVLDHQDPRVAYASVFVGTQWELRRYTTLNGVDFHGVPVTSGSSGKQVRPAPVMGHFGDLAVLWMSGRYDTAADWDVGTMGAGTVLPDPESTGEFVQTPPTAAEVRDAGRWEVVVDGNPATAVTTPDGTDWVYGWIPG